MQYSYDKILIIVLGIKQSRNEGQNIICEASCAQRGWYLTHLTTSLAPLNLFNTLPVRISYIIVVLSLLHVAI